MVKHTKGFKGLSKKVLSAILAASMIMTSSSFVMAAEPTEEPVPVESTANDVETTEVETEEETEVETEETTNEVAAFAAPEAADVAEGRANQADKPYVDAVADQTYTGEEIKPRITVKKNDGTTIPASDYEVYYHNNIDAAKATDDVHPYVEVVFKTGDAQSIEKAFTIKPASITKATVKWDSIDAFVYDGTEKYPAVDSVTLNGFDGELSTDDYEVKVVEGNGKAINQGTYTAKIVGKGNFEGDAQATKTFTIDPADLGKADVTVDVEPIPYSNALVSSTVKNAISVVDNTNDKSVAFTIQWQNAKGEWISSPANSIPKDIGTHPIRIVATGGNFEKGTYIETEYEIVESATLQSIMDNATVGGSKQETYSGDDYFPVGEYDDDTLEGVGNLKYGLDYKIVSEKEEWINAGEYALEIVGLNKYDGQTATVKFTIAPYALTVNDVKATQGTHPNSKNPADVIVTVTDSRLDEDDRILQEGTDYTYVATQNASGKGGYVEVTGIGNYTTEKLTNGVAKKTYKTDAKLDLADPSVSARVTKDVTYDGTKVTLSLSDIEVVEIDGDKSYTLTSDDFGFKTTNDSTITVAGEKTITIVGRGDYTGEREIVLDVNGTSFADTFDIAEIKDVKYNDGKKVSDIADAVKLTYKATGGKYTNFTVEVYNAEGTKLNANTPLNVGGTYTVRVLPKGNNTIYVGYIETTFDVIGQDLKELKASIAAIDDQVYTGEEIKPTVVVTVDDETLKEGEDYTVAYSNNVNAGSADVVVTGINEYSGTVSTTFNITKGQQTIEMTNPLQERDLANGTRTTTSKNCTLKLGFGLEDKVNLSYSSDNEDVATVANGVITYQGVGECTITVTAKETDNCLEATLPIKVVVGKVGTPTFTPSVTSKTAAKSITVTSSTVRGADGFEVQYSIRSDWWRATTVDFDGTTNGKLYRQTIKTYHSNKKYYVRVRAYQVVDGVKQYSDWSPAKTATTK